MIEQEPQLSPQEQLQIDVEAARQATQSSGDYKKTEPGDEGNLFKGTEEEMGGSALGSDPGIRVGQNNIMGQEFRIDAHATAKTPDSRASYRVYQADNKDGREDGKVEIRRFDPVTAETTYTHTFKDPDTARRFGSLITRQVTRRAEAEVNQYDKAA